MYYIITKKLFNGYHMLKIILTATTIFISTTVPANTVYTSVPITSSTPVYVDMIISEPFENCYLQEFRSSNSSATDQIIGGILGGAIGNQFGDGSGKDVMTVAGALLGASIANDNYSSPHYSTREVCETSYRDVKKTVLSHYDIIYMFNEKSYTFRSKTIPRIDTIRLKIKLTPFY